MAFIIFFLKKFEKVGFFRAKFFFHCTLSLILGAEPNNDHFHMIFLTAKEEEAKIHDPTKLTKLDSKRPSYATLDHLSELSRDLGKPLDLILMDGTIKTVQKEYIEEGGMIFEDMRVDSIPSYLEKHLLEEVLGEFKVLECIGKFL